MTPGAEQRMCVIIAAYNEEGYIGHCLKALLLQHESAGKVQIVVSANACKDRTVPIVESHRSEIEARGWTLTVVESPTPGKIGALNRGDAAATGDMRIYLDADVLCDPPLLGQLREVLRRDEALYATGTLQVAPAKTWVTRRYAALWTQLPFVKSGAVGAGLFAVNGQGRARWGEFPDIISDDTFVRLNFTPAERIEVSARYHWPMVEGLQNLIRVRRRQDAGVEQIKAIYPELLANEGKAELRKSDLVGFALTHPISLAVYLLVHIMVRMRKSGMDWTRGR